MYLGLAVGNLFIQSDMFFTRLNDLYQVIWMRESRQPNAILWFGSELTWKLESGSRTEIERFSL